MNQTPHEPPAPPLLRTLAPALRNLATRLRAWLEGPHPQPFQPIARAALEGEAIAQAAFTRPTTRDPVVYYHRSLRPERLDPALRHCKLVAHERHELEQKVLVDTPDLDSNEPENRAKLEQLLPIADVVLY